MSYLRHLALPFCGLTLFASSLAACGGSFSGSGSDGSSGAGGGAGGSSSAGSSGSGVAKGCLYEGERHKDGASFAASDGCNTCSCDNGAVGCTLIGCGGQCFYEGKYYQSGDSFPAADGCNTCGCSADGSVGCTEIGCNSCDNIAKNYAAAIDDARACDPQQANQCSKLIGESLTCGCEVAVNAENAKAIGAAQAAQEQYAALICYGDVACGACLPPSSFYCSADGRCETVRGAGADAACKVNGVTYQSGSSGIPDPGSCNKCQCVDGQLICTEIYCPVECPPNSVFSTQCAHCGPADGCEVVEHACLPVCADTCDAGFCADGICRSLCG